MGLEGDLLRLHDTPENHPYTSALSTADLGRHRAARKSKTLEFRGVRSTKAAHRAALNAIRLLS